MLLPFTQAVFSQACCREWFSHEMVGRPWPAMVDDRPWGPGHLLPGPAALVIAAHQLCWTPWCHHAHRGRPIARWSSRLTIDRCQLFFTQYQYYHQQLLTTAWASVFPYITACTAVPVTCCYHGHSLTDLCLPLPWIYCARTVINQDCTHWSDPQALLCTLWRTLIYILHAPHY